MEEFTVEFRIYGKDLNPASITADLGLEASTVQIAGHQRGDAFTFKESMWGYNGLHEDQETSWDSLEDGVRFLIQKLLPVKGKIVQYQTQYETVFWCGYFHPNKFSTEIILSPSLLKLLGGFGTKLILYSYSFDAE